MEYLKLGVSLLIQAETSSGEFFAIEGPQRLLLYLFRAIRVSSDSQRTYARSIMCMQSQSCICMPIPKYVECLAEAHPLLFLSMIFPLQGILRVSMT